MLSLQSLEVMRGGDESGTGQAWDPERVLFDYNQNREVLQKCLDVVADYVKQNQLLVVGGMAIDFALRLKGEQLYGDNAVPDYDVVDNDNIRHANTVGEMLCTMGVADVAIVPAIHKTTVRVQALGYTVFDVTFVPKKLYEKIPYREWGGFRFIDPVFQKVDQFTSLALLWDITGPSFNILNRLKKDIKRKEMLNQHYRLEDMAAGLHNGSRASMKTQTLVMEMPKIVPSSMHSGVYHVDVLLAGKAAFAVFKHMYKALCPKSTRLNINVLDARVAVEGGKLHIAAPHAGDGSARDTTWEVIVNTSSDPSLEAFGERDPGGAAPVKFTKLSTSLSTVHPAHMILHRPGGRECTLKVFNQYGHNLSINIVDVSVKALGTLVPVANCNFVLAYFLFMHFLEKDTPAGDMHLDYYVDLLNMMEDVQSHADTYPAELVKLFSISMTIMQNDGGYWVDENYTFFLKNFDNLQINRANLTSVPPKNYLKHPKCDVQKKFDIAASEYYEEYHVTAPEHSS